MTIYSLGKDNKLDTHYSMNSYYLHVLSNSKQKYCTLNYESDQTDDSKRIYYPKTNCQRADINEQFAKPATSSLPSCNLMPCIQII